MIALLHKLYKTHTLEELLNFSDIHGIACFMYDEVMKDDHPKSLLLREPLRDRALLMGIATKCKQKEALKIVQLFNTTNIDYCIIKGIALMNYYVYPYFRHMGDIDIWVKLENVDKVVALLDKEGYTRNDSEEQSKHITLNKSNSLTIEVHFELLDPWSFREHTKLMEEFWQCRASVVVNNQIISTLRPDAHFKYLILHKIAHIRYSGFGVKQLMDLVAIVNSKIVRPEDFVEYFNNLGFGVFYKSVVVICQKYAGMKITDLQEFVDFDDVVLDQLFDFIIESGAFGNHSEKIRIERDKRFMIKTADKTKIFPQFIYSILPPIRRLGSRYSYAKKYPVLLPIAWIHRILIAISRSDISFVGKASYLVKAENSDRKDAMLKSLELDY